MKYLFCLLLLASCSAKPVVEAPKQVAVVEAPKQVAPVPVIKKLNVSKIKNLSDVRLVLKYLNLSFPYTVGDKNSEAIIKEAGYLFE